MNRCDSKCSNYVHSPPVSPPGSGSERIGTHGQSYMITAKASKLSLVPSPLLVVGTAHQKWAGNQTKQASHNSVVLYKYANSLFKLHISISLIGTFTGYATKVIDMTTR